MRFRVALLTFSLLLPSAVASAEERTPRIAVAYDIGFKGDGGFNDAVSAALALAKRRFDLVPPFVREVPTSGTAVDRLSKLRFLAKNGYTLIITVGSGYRETVRRVSMEYPETQFAPINDKTLGQLN
ncbi:MAG: BMP family ABC transporter substrate-binding protein, partial [Actinomycetota bacterium]